MPNRGILWPFMPKPRLTKKRGWRDRLRAFGIHFFFGAILGSVLGLAGWIFYFSGTDSARIGLRCLAGGAGLGGLVAGIARDEFWSGRSQPRSAGTRSKSREPRLK